jgi:hypothetical protein
MTEQFISYLFYFTLVSTPHVEAPVFRFVLEKRIKTVTILAKVCTVRKQIKFRDANYYSVQNISFSRLLPKNDTDLWNYDVTSCMTVRKFISGIKGRQNTG